MAAANIERSLGALSGVILVLLRAGWTDEQILAAVSEAIQEARELQESA